MKKLILSLCILFAGSTALFAQPGNPNREDKIKSLYIAYMTEELNINATEAQSFWPIHAQYQSEMEDLSPTMQELDRQQAALNIKKKYQDRFSKILGAERTNLFFVKDQEFRRKMIEKLRQLRQNKQGPDGMRPLRPGNR